MRYATIAKLVVVVVMALAGFFVGHSSSPPSESQPTPDRIRTGNLARNQSAGEGERPSSRSPAQPSPKGSLLAKFLKFERQLATCDIALLRPMLEKACKENPNDYEQFLAIARAWWLRDPEGFVAWVPTQPALIPSESKSSHSTGFRDTFISVIANDDPETALQIAERVNASDHTKWSIVKAAIKKDPELGLHLAKTKPEAFSRQIDYVGNHPSGIDPMQALPVLEALHSGSGRAALVNDGANYYAQNPDKIAAAATWFQQLPADAQRQIIVKFERDQFMYEWDPQPEVEAFLPKLREIWKLPEE